jgi:septal ring-binding cell division protein DamX
MIEKVSMYCPICDKQIEKYGRRKNDPKILGWTFCPKHGWIKEGVDEGEMREEKTAESAEEASKKHTEQEKPSEEKNFRTPSEIKKPEASSIPEEEQLRTDLPDETETKITDLSTMKINFFGLTPIAVIISIIFVTILLVFLFNFLFWKSSANKNLEMKSYKVIVSAETSDKQFQSQASVLPEEESSQSKTEDPPKEIKDKSLRPLIPSKTVFTVQVGAFEDASYAEALKKELNKKGYKVYITTLELKGNEKLHKVCIGRFSSREKAEVLSTKIKKKEGLQTFVTFGIV